MGCKDRFDDPEYEAHKAKQDALWARRKAALEAIDKTKCSDLTVNELKHIMKMTWHSTLSLGDIGMNEADVQELEEILKRIK